MFIIVHPDIGECVFARPNAAAGGALSMLVQVFNTSDFIQSFAAFVFDVGGAATLGSTTLIRTQNTNRWSALVPVGGNTVLTPGTPAANNKTVLIIASETSSSESQSNDFKCALPGSGSNSGSEEFPFATHAAVILGDKPLPAALNLLLDSPVRPGTCSHCDQLNGPMLLVYSHDVEFAGCWFSQPIELCADGSVPALWMLQVKDSLTWTLVLRHKDAQVATYQFKAAAATDVRFPMTLQIVGKGGKECKNWPRSVTIGAA